MGSIGAPSNIHLVYCAFPGYGHVRPLRSLAKSLSAAGYTATFITSDAFRSSLEVIPNVDFFPFSGRINVHPDDFIDQFPERRNQPQDATLAIWDLEHVFFGSMDESFTAIQSVLSRAELSNKRVILLTDGFLTGALPVSLETHLVRRVPVVAIANFPLFFMSKDTAPFGTGLLNMGEEKNEEMNKMTEQMFAGVTAAAKKMLVKYDCKKSVDHYRGPLDYMFFTPEVYIQLTVPQMEPPRKHAPAHLKFAGTLLGSNDNKGFPDWWDSFVVKDHSDPLIAVTSGTVPSNEVGELILPTIEACRGLPVRLVVCAVCAVIPENYDLPSNVKVATWLPFEDLFQHTSIVVTNGGYGGINQAFAYGLPMIVAGVTEDKIETTARAAMTGAAINLKTKTASVEQVKEALQTVLKDSSYKNKALELKKAYAELDTVGIIEKTIRDQAEKFYG